MLAYRTGLPMGFAPGLTILSALIAMTLVRRGLRAGASAVSGAAGRRGDRLRHRRHALYRHGGGASCPRRAVWDWRYVTASVLIGVSVSGLALHFALRRKSRRDYALGAGLFTLAIVGLHFTAMTAVRYMPDGSHPCFRRM